MPNRVRVKSADGHGFVSVDLDDCVEFRVNCIGDASRKFILQSRCYYYTNDKRWILKHYIGDEEGALHARYTAVGPVQAARDFLRYSYPFPPTLKPYREMVENPALYAEHMKGNRRIPDTTSKKKEVKLPQSLSRRNKPQRLISYMIGRQEATYQEISENVHDNEDIQDDAIRKNVQRANEILVIDKKDYILACSSGTVRKIENPV